MISELRRRLEVLFESDHDTPEIKHFPLKLVGGIALLSIETFIIMQLCYRLIGPCPFGAVLFSSMALAVAIDISILKISQHNNS